MGFSLHKKTRPFGLIRTPYNPQSGKRLDLAYNDGDIIAMDIISIPSSLLDKHTDIIWCKPNLHESIELIAVTKPYLFMRIPFDGKVINNIGYVFTDNFTRIATEFDDDGVETGVSETQLITPSYIVGEQLLIARCHGKWIDMNTAGRCWAVEPEEEEEEPEP